MRPSTAFSKPPAGWKSVFGEIEQHGGALNQLDAKLFELTEFLMASEPQAKPTEVDVELV